MAEEHPLKPFYSVLVLAFGCSLLVAAAAVSLKPFQEANKSLDRKKNILAAAGIYTENKPIEQQFQAVETRIVNLENGNFVPPETIDPDTFDQRQAALSEKLGSEIKPSEDKAGISRIEKYSLVYLVRDQDRISQIVLPVRGKGLWSTMYAYVSLDSDLSTIRGVSFYEHGETPGLGGEVENPRWQNGWKNKKLFTEDGQMEFRVVKDPSRETPEKQPYLVDSISGATLTSKGVDHLMQFWFGDHGFKPFIDRIKNQGGLNG